MSQDPPAFSALWAARQEATGLGAEPGASSPLQWAVRDPGASPHPGEGRHPSRTSPDHGLARVSSRKSWATQGGRVCGAPTRAGSRAGSAPRSGTAPGHPTGSLPPHDQPLCCGWGVTQGDEGQQRGWGRGLGAPLGQGPPSQPSPPPRCVPPIPPLPAGLWAQGFHSRPSMQARWGWGLAGCLPGAGPPELFRRVSWRWGLRGQRGLGQAAGRGGHRPGAQWAWKHGTTLGCGVSTREQ